MININDKITKKNALVLSVGLILFALSFVLIALVGQNPEGFMGFIAPFTMLIGIIVTAAGFLIK